MERKGREEDVASPEVFIWSLVSSLWEERWQAAPGVQEAVPENL